MDIFEKAHVDTVPGLKLLFKKEWIVYLCFLIVPLSVPLDFSGGIRVSFPSEIIMALLGAMFLVLAVMRPTVEKKLLAHPLTLLIFLDVCWMIAATGFSTMPVVSIKRVAIKIGFIVFFYLFMALWFKRPRNMVWPFLLYAIGILPVILFSIKKHAGYNFVPEVTYNICQPFYQDHTIYGASLAFLIPFLIIIFWNAGMFGINLVYKSLIGTILLIVLAGVGLSFSRASMLSLVAVLIFYGLMKLKIRIGGILILLSLGLIFGYSQYEVIYEKILQNQSLSNKGDVTEHFKSVGNISSDASNLERINRWTCAYKMFRDKPMTGFGPGTYQFKYGKYQSPDQLTRISTFSGDRGNAHSEYFTYLSETGLPGLLVFLILVFYTIALGLRVYYNSGDPVVRLLALAALLGLITFFVHGLVNAFIEQDKMAALVYPAMAVLVALDIYHQKTNSVFEMTPTLQH